jgi:hypothetical protein
MDNSAYPQISVNISLSLTLPANATGPSPVMMVLAGGGSPAGPVGGGPGGRQGGGNGPAGTSAPGARTGGRAVERPSAARFGTPLDKKKRGPVVEREPDPAQSAHADW